MNAIANVPDYGTPAARERAGGCRLWPDPNELVRSVRSAAPVPGRYAITVVVSTRGLPPHRYVRAPPMSGCSCHFIG